MSQVTLSFPDRGHRGMSITDRLGKDIMLGTDLPSKKTITYPTEKNKENRRLKNALGMGYVTSREGKDEVIPVSKQLQTEALGMEPIDVDCMTIQNRTRALQSSAVSDHSVQKKHGVVSRFTCFLLLLLTRSPHFNRSHINNNLLVILVI